MSRIRHTSSTVQALYQVFVVPALLQSSASRTLPKQLPASSLTRSQPRLARPFSSTTSCLAKTRVAEERTQKWNEEISARIIQLVDPETNKLSEPVTKFDILNSLDQKTHRLVQLSPDQPGNRSFVPACKIVSKKETYEAEKRAKEAAKEKKRVQKVVSGEGLKTLELNWAIDQNDLGHRINRIKEFLGEGRRVEVVLAAKKRGRKASKEECELVLERIQDAVKEVEGARQRDAMSGKLGGFVTMTFQGRPVKVGSTVTNGEEGGENEVDEKKRRKKWDKSDKGAVEKMEAGATVSEAK
ncbi:Putative translation initiation factor 3 [Septoria linicola]|uniref:Translation initiation factor 3 n=1 Tax=Septoria linicola TaxID=215465 RepID=A0A9Q9AQ10_9PEZI|nr:putative translation initiation factor 3 [Septoria linicola]USW53344.1 Putative translation initiation factor 3 [Septoria linicola]